MTASPADTTPVIDSAFANSGENVMRIPMAYQIGKPMKIQNAPYPHTPPNYGAKTQYAVEENASPLLSKEDTTYIQAVTVTLLYNARAVDPTILPALSAIATEQAKPTQTTMKNVRQLLDYCSTQEEAIITYNASKMILAVHSDAGYAKEKKS